MDFNPILRAAQSMIDKGLATIGGPKNLFSGTAETKHTAADLEEIDRVTRVRLLMYSSFTGMRRKAPHLPLLTVDIVDRILDFSVEFSENSYSAHKRRIRNAFKAAAKGKMPLELMFKVFEQAEIWPSVSSLRVLPQCGTHWDFPYLVLRPPKRIKVCQFVRLTIYVKSCDQGWSSYPEFYGTKSHSWTWGEVGIIRGSFPCASVMVLPEYIEPNGLLASPIASGYSTPTGEFSPGVVLLPARENLIFPTADGFDGPALRSAVGGQALGDWNPASRRSVPRDMNSFSPEFPFYQRTVARDGRKYNNPSHTAPAIDCTYRFLTKLDSKARDDSFPYHPVGSRYKLYTNTHADPKLQTHIIDIDCKVHPLFSNFEPGDAVVFYANSTYPGWCHFVSEACMHLYYEDFN